MQFYALSEELFHNSIQRRFTGDIFLGHLHLELLSRKEIQTLCFLFVQNFVLYHRFTGCGAKGGAAPPPPQDKKKIGQTQVFWAAREIGQSVCSLFEERHVLF